VLSFDGAIILLPMCRNILRYIRPKIRFLPLDESQWFHRQVAYSLLVYTIIHVCAHYVKYVIQNVHITFVLTSAASSMWREHKSERSRLFRFTIQKLEASLAISCSSACFSCTQPLTPRSVSNHSRRSGIPIISSFHSCWDYIPMPLDASFATPSSHSLLLTIIISGPTALVMRVGGGSFGEVVSISLNGFIERSGQDERPRL